MKKNQEQDLSIQALTARELPEYAEVIRQSFATVAREFGLTKETCPAHPSLISNEALRERFKEDYTPFGLFVDGKLAGFMSLTNKGGGVFVMNNVAVLPEYRHLGCGKALLEFCKAKVRELGGRKLEIDIIEDNTVLKNWYIANDFVNIGTERFDHLPFTVGYMEWTVPE